MPQNSIIWGKNVKDFDSLVKFHVITPVKRKIILADIANLAEIAFLADIVKLANLVELSRLRIADKVSRAEPSRFSNGHLYLGAALPHFHVGNPSLDIRVQMHLPLAGAASGSSRLRSGVTGSPVASLLLSWLDMARFLSVRIFYHWLSLTSFASLFYHA